MKCKQTKETQPREKAKSNASLLNAMVNEKRKSPTSNDDDPLRRRIKRTTQSRLPNHKNVHTNSREGEE
jgi:hypothetical protein